MKPLLLCGPIAIGSLAYLMTTRHRAFAYRLVGAPIVSIPMTAMLKAGGVDVHQLAAYSFVGMLGGLGFSIAIWRNLWRLSTPTLILAGWAGFVLVVGLCRQFDLHWSAWALLEFTALWCTSRAYSRSQVPDKDILLQTETPKANPAMVVGLQMLAALLLGVWMDSAKASFPQYAVLLGALPLGGSVLLAATHWWEGQEETQTILASFIRGTFSLFAFNLVIACVPGWFGYAFASIASVLLVLGMNRQR